MKSPKKIRFISLFLGVILLFSSLSFSDDSANIEEILKDIAINDPTREVVMILVLDTDNEGLLDELKEATKEIDDEISLINEESKKKFSELKEELGYNDNKDEILKLFNEKDEEFMKKFNDLEKKCFAMIRRIMI